MTLRRICDVCHGGSPSNHIPFSRKVNGDQVELEICDFCLQEVASYIDTERARAEEQKDLPLPPRGKMGFDERPCDCTCHLYPDIIHSTACCDGYTPQPIKLRIVDRGPDKQNVRL